MAKGNPGTKQPHFPNINADTRRVMAAAPRRLCGTGSTRSSPVDDVGLVVETVSDPTVSLNGPTPFLEGRVRIQYPSVDLNLGATLGRCSSPTRIRSRRPRFQLPGP